MHRHSQGAVHPNFVPFTLIMHKNALEYAICRQKKSKISWIGAKPPPHVPPPFNGRPENEIIPMSTQRKSWLHLCFHVTNWQHVSLLKSNYSNGIEGAIHGLFHFRNMDVTDYKCTFTPILLKIYSAISPTKMLFRCACRNCFLCVSNVATGTRRPWPPNRRLSGVSYRKKTGFVGTKGLLYSVK